MIDDEHGRQDHTFARVPAALIADPDMSAAAIRAYAAIACFAGRDGVCWPGRKRIAEQMGGCSLPTVDRAIAALVAAGWLTVERRERPDGASTSNRYVLHGLPAADTDRRDADPDRRDADPSGVVESDDPPLVRFDEGGATNLRPHRTRPREPEEELAYASSLASTVEMSDDAKSAACVPTSSRRRDLLWESVMATCGIVEPIPRSARGAYNRAVAELRAAGVDPAEVPIRARVFRLRWPSASLTPTALARRWAECAPDPQHLPAPKMRAAHAALARVLHEENMR